VVIDVHHHYAPPSLADRLRQLQPRLRAFLSGPLVDGESRLAAMDKAGVDAAMLSIPHPGFLDAQPDRATYRGLISGANDELIAFAQRHPDRFGVLIALPLAAPDDAVDELTRVGGHELVRGIIAFATSGTGLPLDAPELAPVYQAIGRRPVLLHPAMDQLTRHEAFAGFGLSSLAAPVETSAAAARLMLSGMLDRVPDLTLIIPHLGGVLPYVIGRLADQAGGAAERDILSYLSNRCFVDSCSHHHQALMCAAETLSPDRILLGSDYPARGSLARAVADIEGSPLDAANRHAILGGNAERLGLVPLRPGWSGEEGSPSPSLAHLTAVRQPSTVPCLGGHRLRSRGPVGIEVPVPGSGGQPFAYHNSLSV
jgi:predicted TIM-barrel fold metal-dependent hydrolase